MNREQFEGNFRQFKGKIKEKWGKLTDDDIAQMNGKYDQFIGKLQKRYGFSKEHAEKEMHNWSMDSRDTMRHERREDQSWGHENSEKRWEDKANWEPKEGKPSDRMEGNMDRNHDRNERNMDKNLDKSHGKNPQDKEKGTWNQGNQDWKKRHGEDEHKDKKRKAG